MSVEEILEEGKAVLGREDLSICGGRTEGTRGQIKVTERGKVNDWLMPWGIWRKCLFKR